MIDNLEEKLKGTIPVTREELFELVSSWGRIETFITNDNIYKKCEPNECYPLENLNVSEITDLSYIFRDSPYNGDLSKWNISSCLKMSSMFVKAKFNNDSLKNWNISKVKNMDFMFYRSKFNGDISNWNVSNIINMQSAFDNSPFDADISKWKFNKDVCCYEIFSDNDNFENKYNDGYEIPSYTEDFLEWVEANRLNISNANVSKEERVNIDDYLDSFNKNINEIK